MEFSLSEIVSIAVVVVLVLIMVYVSKQGASEEAAGNAAVPANRASAVSAPTANSDVITAVIAAAVNEYRKSN